MGKSNQSKQVSALQSLLNLKIISNLKFNLIHFNFFCIKEQNQNPFFLIFEKLLLTMESWKGQMKNK